MENSPLPIRWFPVVLLVSLLSFSPVPAAGEVVTITGSGASLVGIRLLAEAFTKAHPDIRVEVLPILGSGGSIKAVRAGKLDIGVSSRSLTDKERGPDIESVLYARAPFVFGVHRGVKATAMTLREIVDIYNGRKKSWDDGTAIRLIMRREGESDLDVLRGISKEMESAVSAAFRREGMIYAINDHRCVDLLEETPGAFGAFCLPMVTQEKHSIRVLSLDGVSPSVAALAAGAYPYGKEFSFITRKATSPAVRSFIAFARSREGGAILSRAGFLPLR